MENEWKDLEIGNIPEFVQDKVDVQRLVNDEWVDCKISKASIVYGVVEKTISTKYRYRLKPLESIRITKKLHDELLLVLKSPSITIKDVLWNDIEIKSLDGRPLEIIDENT